MEGMKEGDYLIKNIEIVGILSLKDKNLSAGIKATSKNLKQFNKEIEGVTQVAQQLIEKAGGVDQVLADMGIESLVTLKDSINNVKSEVDNTISYAKRLGENMNTIRELGMSAFGAIKESTMLQGAFESLNQWGQNTFEDLRQKAIDRFGGAFNKVREVGQNAFESIRQQAADKFGSTFDGILQRGQGAFQNIKDQASSKMAEAFEGIRESSTVLFQGLRQRAEDFSNKFEGIKQKGTEAFQNVKQRSMEFEEKLISMRDTGAAAFATVNQKIQEYQPAIDSVKSVIGELETNVAGLKDSLAGAFEGAQPAIEWLNNNGLPGMGGFVSQVADKSMDLYNFIDTNWSRFQPIINGISGAMELYEGATVAVQRATEIYTKVTDGLVMAQGFLNKVMNMSPWGIAAMAIAGLIAAGVLLYQNWDTIKEKALMLWESIKSIFGGVAEFFHQTFSSAFEGIVNFFTPAIDLINGVIEGLNKLNFKMPNLLGGKEFKINIPTISLPQFAMGTAYAREGFALIHERGGEIRYTSRGETIIPADKSKQMIEKINHGSNITININGSNLTAADVVNEMVPKLKLALSNM